ncbi:hypothetical protein PG994_002405 [Apiospora phragmitis]|uniref:Uncharacterized protein n=1 Tax=Apiospora phragmitis TaxID=2905665 RepID=A0ABR1WW92_9PEZI
MTSGITLPTKLQSESPVAGCAESLIRRLKAPDHSCGDFPKYRIVPSQTHHDYPSRLGFFQISKSEPVTRQSSARHVLISSFREGYNYWSILSTPNKVEKGQSSTTTQESGYAGRKSKWLDAPSLASHYPPILQARTEQVPGREGFTAGANVNQCPSISTTISIPQVPWASEAWRWLSSQRKPFYIGQLHLIKGWTPLGEALAARDFLIAEKTGKPFIPTTQQVLMKMTNSTREMTKDPKPNGIGATSTGINNEDPKAAKTNKTTKATRKTNAPSPGAPNPPATIFDPTAAIFPSQSNTTKDPPLYLSKTPGKEKLPTVRTSKDKSTSSPKITKTDIPPPDPIRPSGEHTQDAEIPSKVTGKPQRKPQSKSDANEHSTKPVLNHTRNYNRYEPFPFDSPIKPPSLKNYKRVVEDAVRTQTSPSQLPLEEILGKDYTSAKKSKDLLRGPDSSAKEEDVLALTGSSGPRKKAGPKTSHDFIEAMAKAKPKVPATSKKTDGPSLHQYKPTKVKTPKSRVESAEFPRDKLTQNAPATSRNPTTTKSLATTKTPATAKTLATNKTPATPKKLDGPSLHEDKPKKVETPKSRFISTEPSRDKSTRNAPAMSKTTDRRPLQHGKTRKEETPKSKFVYT